MKRRSGQPNYLRPVRRGHSVPTAKVTKAGNFHNASGIDEEYAIWLVQ
jgi:hypothetical protein